MLKFAIYSAFAALLLQACAPTNQVATATHTSNDAETLPTAEPITVDSLMQSCPTAEEVAAIDAATEVIFVDDPTAPELLCTVDGGSKDLTLLQKNVYNTLRIMQLIDFDLPLPWTDLQLFDWFSEAVTGVVFDRNAEFSRCCDKEGHIVVQTQYLLAAQTELWVDSYHGGAGVASLLGMLVHEARHAEGFRHLCSKQAGSDLNLGEMGAWAVENYLYLWITDHTHNDFFTNYYREIAHANSLLILETRFCENEVFPP